MPDIKKVADEADMIINGYYEQDKQSAKPIQGSQEMPHMRYFLAPFCLE